MDRPDHVHVCPGEEQLPDSEVRICDEDKVPESVVKICDEDDCEDLAPLTLQGSTAPSNGSQYQASGGKTPYVYTVTGGATMANDGATGTISGLQNGCGTGTVTVVDACGSRVSIDFRYPNGQWVSQGTVYCPTGASSGSHSCYAGVYYYEYSANLFSAEATCPLPAGCWVEGESNDYYALTTYAWECV
jgi:hypothetical protein